MSVTSVGGPGSMDINVKIGLDNLRNRLLQAGHPLANAPQWNGDKVWTVECTAPKHRTRIMVIKAKTRDRAEGVALANLKTRNGPEWKVCDSQMIVFGSAQCLAVVEVMRSTGLNHEDEIFVRKEKDEGGHFGIMLDNMNSERFTSVLEIDRYQIRCSLAATLGIPDSEIDVEFVHSMNLYEIWRIL